MAKTKKQKEIKKVVRESETDKIRKMDEAMILKQIKELKQELFNLVSKPRSANWKTPLPSAKPKSKLPG